MLINFSIHYQQYSYKYIQVFEKGGVLLALEACRENNANNGEVDIGATSRPGLRSREYNYIVGLDYHLNGNKREMLKYTSVVYTSTLVLLLHSTATRFKGFF